MTMKTTTAERLFRAGYTDLVSVIPPGARLSATSRIPPDQLGKAPGRRNYAGTWGGYDWQKHPTALKDAVTWDMHGANVGLRAARFPAVDIDTTDPELAAMIERRAREILGDTAPKRTGRAPKGLLVYRTETPFGRMRLWLTDGEGVAHLIEVLGDGQQYVVAGTHPSGATYSWDTPLDEIDPHELFAIEPADVERFFEAVTEDADFLGLTASREGNGSTSVDREGIDQSDLRAPSLEAVQAAVAAIPNSNDEFPGRNDYLRMGYAIKASCGEEGLATFLEWADRWEGNDRAEGNDPEEAERDWAKMVPPYEVGWEYLATTARRHGYSDAGDDFQADPTLPPIETAIAAPGPAPDAEASKEDEPPPAYSEAAASRTFINRFGGNLRHCGGLGGWMVYDKGVWSQDETLWAEYAAGKLCRQLAMTAGQDESLGKSARAMAMKLGSNAAKQNVLNYSRSDRRLAARADDFDSDPWALNTPAGVVDLQSGALKAHDAKGLHSRITGTAPAEGTPVRWLQFLHEATGGDLELLAYLQKLAGYTLTGVTREQMLSFVWGPGGNGKSVFINILSAALGTYAVTTPPETFAASKGDRHPTEMAAIRGARLVTATETQEGRAWDEGKVKLATGGDPISARFMNQDFFTFRPVCKVVMLGNHKPRIANLDAAMKRRIHLVPFTVTPAVPDKQLEEKLKDELPQILAWAIEGCRLWQEQGLTKPAVVEAATQEYFTDEDPVGRFIEERCVVREGATSMGSNLYKAWAEWAHDQGENLRTQRWLTNALLSRGGIDRWRDPKSGLRGLRGVELLYEPGEFEAQAIPARQAA